MKSYKGREVNVNKIFEEQAKTMAIGNMRINARGDVIGIGGKIVKTREQLENEYVDKNPNAAIDKQKNAAGFNRGLAEYRDKVIEKSLSEQPESSDPYKETSSKNKNLSTDKNEKVKFSDTTKKSSETTIDDLPLDDDIDDQFEVSDDPAPNKKTSTSTSTSTKK